MRVVADQQGRELAEVASEAGAEFVCGSSLKAALDRDWDQQVQKDEALALVLQVLHTVDAWVHQLADQEEKAVAEPLLAIAKQVEEQDVQMSEEGKVNLVKGVANDRRMSVEDSEMRHGRKSRSVRVDGYKRHVLFRTFGAGIQPVIVNKVRGKEFVLSESIYKRFLLTHASIYVCWF